MKSAEQLKAIVKEKYGTIAHGAKNQDTSSCCDSSCGCSSVEFTVMAENYSALPGYVPGADLALGCGLPTEHARLRPGDTVVDLGAGAGNDCFVARSVVGDAGRVIGVDMTDAMVAKARANAQKLGFQNVEFLLGDIEQMPLESDLADVVVSNCVMNLVPDKKRAFAETFRILKPGGHFSISDIVLQGDLPEEVRRDAALYAGCISGALQKDEYLGVIKEAGFVDLTIQKEKRITIPEDILQRHLPPELVKDFHKSHVGIFSITVFARKPSAGPHFRGT
jgi:arsenite methyltransferase